MIIKITEHPETAATRHDFYLEEIEIENFRCFEHLKVALHPRMNVFVGANASGKTAIFDAIQKVVGIAPNLTLYGRRSTLDAKYSDYVFFSEESIFEETDEHVLYSSKNIEKIKNIKITSYYKENIIYKNTLKSFFINNSEMKRKNVVQWQIFREHNRNEISNSDEYPNMAHFVVPAKPQKNSIFPIFVSHNTSRLTEKIDDSIPIPIRGSRLNAYAFWNKGSLVATQAFNKWANEHDYNIYQAERLGTPPEEASPEFIVVREAIKSSVPGCKEIYFNVRDKEVHYTFEDGRDFPFSYWSDGVRNLIRLVGDIALRCAILNPDMGIQANETPGIVLIDEVDLHLHPGWQRQVLPGLMRAFPNIQFIVTTHSPQVLSSVPGECVFVLENFDIKKNSDGTVFHPFTQERDSNAILQDAFGVPVLEPQAEAELHAIYQHITDGDAEGARALLDNLILKRGEDDFEVQRMNTYLEML